ncbi:MAG: prepilin-type N-terminal cleavage/methylation domain-containing protein [Planctomycetota bacterium]
MLRLSRQDDARRSAFTLLELLIVLVLLAFMVAITWPLLRKPLQRSLTEQAARQLREDLARARLNAIESGRAMAIHYELDGGKYWIAPADTATGDEPSFETLEDERNSRAGDKNGDGAGIQLVIQGELEDGVVFQDPAIAEERDTTSGSTLDSMLADHMAETEEVEPLVEDSRSETSWSPAALIYPTGRAENASFLLVGPENYMVAVSLRGLTGAVSIGPLKQRSSTRQGETRQGEESTAESGNQPPEDNTRFPQDAVPTRH